MKNCIRLSIEIRLMYMIHSSQLVHRIFLSLIQRYIIDFIDFNYKQYFIMKVNPEMYILMLFSF